MTNPAESNDSLIKQLKAANKKISELEAAVKNSTRVQDNNLTNTEETLQEYGVHFQNIIDASPVPYALNDDNNIIYINPAFTKTFGYEITDIPTLSDWWPKAYPDHAYREWVSATPGMNTSIKRLKQATHSSLLKSTYNLRAVKIVPL